MLIVQWHEWSGHTRFFRRWWDCSMWCWIGCHGGSTRHGTRTSSRWVGQGGGRCVVVCFVFLDQILRCDRGGRRNRRCIFSFFCAGNHHVNRHFVFALCTTDQWCSCDCGMVVFGRVLEYRSRSRGRSKHAGMDDSRLTWRHEKTSRGNDHRVSTHKMCHPAYLGQRRKI